MSTCVEWPNGEKDCANFRANQFNERFSEFHRKCSCVFWRLFGHDLKEEDKYFLVSMSSSSVTDTFQISHGVESFISAYQASHINVFRGVVLPKAVCVEVKVVHATDKLTCNASSLCDNLHDNVASVTSPFHAFKHRTRKT